MSQSGRIRWQGRALLAAAGAVVAGAVAIWASGRSATTFAYRADEAAAACPGPGPCSPTGTVAEVAAPYLAAAEVCADAGYLCADVSRDGSTRLLRWPDDTRGLVVLVEPPDMEDEALALSLQRAAVRGLEAWQGRPFPLTIRYRPGPMPADIEVRWLRQLGDNRLGNTRIRWREEHGLQTLSVDDFVLATRSPFDEDRILSGREVELVAAHEMGHALGLPHSDSPRDVMFPTNTAGHLSARDYRTLDSLYGLPSGAEVRDALR